MFSTAYSTMNPNSTSTNITPILAVRAIMSLGVRLLGQRFAPRLRNLKDRKFHAFEKPDAYPALKAHLGARINIALIRENWDELLRMAASMNERIVAPSAILKKLSASRRPSELARALRELGRIERTCSWSNGILPQIRRRCHAGLNKGDGP